jgi:hypothetical protein
VKPQLDFTCKDPNDTLLSSVLIRIQGDGVAGGAAGAAHAPRRLHGAETRKTVRRDHQAGRGGASQRASASGASTYPHYPHVALAGVTTKPGEGVPPSERAHQVPAHTHTTTAECLCLR